MGIPHRRPRRAGVLTGDVQLSRRDVKSGAADASARVGKADLVVGVAVGGHVVLVPLGRPTRTYPRFRRAVGATAPRRATTATPVGHPGKALPRAPAPPASPPRRARRAPRKPG